MNSSFVRTSFEAVKLRSDVREFLAMELANRSAADRARSWNGFDVAFTKKVAERGWIGMTWPKQFGGGERSGLERYIVMEEMLAWGAPVSAHWIADRQSGPLLLRFGTESQKADILPRMASGNCFTCIGMSEPGSGSDLASIKTKAVRSKNGYRIAGAKLWTTNAHRSHYIVLLARTGEGDVRRDGSSQFLVDLRTPGIIIRPILSLAGAHEFNEVIFDDVFAPIESLIGTEGAGWQQVMAELSYERSGPERFLSSFVLLAEAFRAVAASPTERQAEMLGQLVSHLVVLRRMSRNVAAQLDAGLDPKTQAAIVKDLGATFEQQIPEVIRTLIPGAQGDLAEAINYLTLNAPSFSLRGGTREILRGIIARDVFARSAAEYR